MAFVGADVWVSGLSLSTVVVGEVLAGVVDVVDNDGAGFGWCRMICRQWGSVYSTVAFRVVSLCRSATVVIAWGSLLL